MPCRGCLKRYMIQAEVKMECDISGLKGVERESDPKTREEKCSADFETKENEYFSDPQRSDSDPVLSESKCVKRPPRSEVICDSTKCKPSGVCKKPKVLHGKKKCSKSLQEKRIQM